MKVARVNDPRFPLLTSIAGLGGSTSFSIGSNIVQQITANGSNTVLGPLVNFAAGSNIILAVSSNTINIASTASGGGGSGTVSTIKDEGSTLSTAVVSLDFVGAGVTATGTTAVTVTIPGGGGGGGGGLVFLEGHTASSSSSLDFTSFISSTYDTYQIIGTDIAIATNGQNLLLEIGTGGGPTYDTGSNYEWAFGGRGTGAGAPSYQGSSGIAVLLSGMSNNAGYGFGDFNLIAAELQSTAHRKTLYGTIHYVDSSPASNFMQGGIQWTTLATAVTALRFIPSSGNIASGTIRIYGISKS